MPASRLHRAGDPTPAHARDLTSQALARIQQHLATTGPDPLIITTRHAVATTTSEDLHDLAAAPIWGLARTAQNEHPGRIILIDTDTDPHHLPPATLATALATGEPQLAIRHNTMHIPRLAPAQPPATPTFPPLDPDGTILITGGTGTLGQLLARHLATHHGARHLLLASRHGPDAPGTTELTHDLHHLGATTTITACDTTSPTDLAALLQTIPTQHPLTAVIHLAAVLDDATIETLTPTQLHTVLTPKTDTAWHLHTLTQNHPLTAFILFSSAAGTLGSPGQANYAAANTYLDALAHHRTAHHQPATSLAWGLWATTTTMTAHLTPTDLTRLRRTGLIPLTTPDALNHLDTALTHHQPHLLPMHIQTAALSAQAEAGKLPPPLLGLVRTPLRRAAATSPAENAAAWRERLSGRPEEEQHRLLLDMVRTTIAQILGHPTGATVEADRGLLDLGFDSLSAVELRNQLSAATGLRLPATAAFDYPTAAALARYLQSALNPAGYDPQQTMLAELNRLEAATSALPRGAPRDRLVRAGDDHDQADERQRQRRRGRGHRGHRPAGIRQ